MINVITHPEIGDVLESRCGAQSAGSCYDTAENSLAAAPADGREYIRRSQELWEAGQPGRISAVLASDGWWWRLNS